MGWRHSSLLKQLHHIDVSQSILLKCLFKISKLSGNYQFLRELRQVEERKLEDSGNPKQI
ncbi:MAG TPA: hypothetical protein V6C65_05730, partial [Allocoleopsis sp.]